MSVETEIIDRVIRMTSAIIQLHEALRKYGSHSSDCKSWVAEDAACTCGLVTALHLKNMALSPRGQ